jgi:menaquinone-specific isochorismate synthase
VFCFQPDATAAFIGITPERLFARQGDRLHSEIVAGTRPRGRHDADDRKLKNDLLRSAKDQLEHDIVRKGIRQRLHKFVDDLQVDGPTQVLALASTQHLYSAVHGRLRPGVHDGILIDRLHPTPALGGYPTENALAEIPQLEPFCRGWYGAPVGWIAADAAELAVAIRSALIAGCHASIYSGAGIVPGSTAHGEWEEIEHKIRDYLRLFA